MVAPTVLLCGTSDCSLCANAGCHSSRFQQRPLSPQSVDGRDNFSYGFYAARDGEPRPQDSTQKCGSGGCGAGGCKCVGEKGSRVRHKKHGYFCLYRDSELLVNGRVSYMNDRSQNYVGAGRCSELLPFSRKRMFLY